MSVANVRMTVGIVICSILEFTRNEVDEGRVPHVLPRLWGVGVSNIGPPPSLWAGSRPSGKGGVRHPLAPPQLATIPGGCRSSSGGTSSNGRTSNRTRTSTSMLLLLTEPHFNPADGGVAWVTANSRDSNVVRPGQDLEQLPTACRQRRQCSLKLHVCLQRQRHQPAAHYLPDRGHG